MGRQQNTWDREIRKRIGMSDSCLITSSLISCLIITSVIQSYCHIFSLVATFNFCPWPLPTSHRIMLPVTSAHPLRSSLCPLRSVLLPRRIGIGLQGVSHSSQLRSQVPHLMSHQYVTHLMSHHYVTHLMSHHYVTHLMSHHYVTDTQLLPIYFREATFNICQ